MTPIRVAGVWFAPRAVGQSAQVSNFAPYGTKGRTRFLLVALVVLALATLILSIAINDRPGVVTGMVLLVVAVVVGPLARRNGRL